MINQEFNDALTIDSSKCPTFSSNRTFQEFKFRFLGFAQRFPDVQAALTAPQQQQPVPVVRARNESDDAFREREKERNTEIKVFNRGDSIIFSHLLSSVQNNIRAMNVISHPDIDMKGFKALEALAKEFKDDKSNAALLNSIKGEFQTRAIRSNESVSQFIDSLDEISLRLRHLSHNISDQDMITKILNGMVSAQNTRYSETKNTLTIHPIATLSDLVTRLRSVDNSLLAYSAQNLPSFPLQSHSLSSQTILQSSPPSSLTNPQISPHEANLVSNLSSCSKKTSSSRITCRRCGGAAHYADTCKISWDEIQRKKGLQQTSTYSRSQSRHNKKIFKANSNSRKPFQNKSRQQRIIKEDNGNQRHYANLVAEDTTDPSFLILDSGATDHIFNKRGLLHNFQRIISSVKIANGQSMKVEGKGNCHILKDILFCPEASSNLISISKLIDDGYCFVADSNGTSISKNNIIIFRATRHLGLFIIKPNDLNTSHSLMTSSKVEVTNDILHARLGHPSDRLLRRIHNLELAEDLNYNPRQHTEDCSSCLMAKAHRRANRKEIRDSIPPKQKHPTHFGELLHIDSSGPFSIPAVPNNDLHILIIIDAYSGYLFDFYTTSVNTNFVLASLEEVFAFIIANNGKLSHYHADGALSLIGQEIRNFLISKNLTFSFNAPYNPQDNAFAERSFRSIKEKAVALLQYSSLPSQFWKFACSTAVYLLNRLPKSRHGSFLSPFQIVFGNRPNFAHLRTFGCQAIAHVDKATRPNDFSGKGIRGIFVGYRRYGPGYLLYNPTSNQLKEVASLFFMEKSLVNSEKNFVVEPNTLAINAPVRNIEEYRNLIGLLHNDPDDGLLYITTRIRTHKGLIVAHRALYRPNGKPTEVSDIFHVEDIARYTESYYQRCLNQMERMPNFKRKLDEIQNELIKSPKGNSKARNAHLHPQIQIQNESDQQSRSKNTHEKFISDQPTIQNESSRSSKGRHVRSKVIEIAKNATNAEIVQTLVRGAEPILPKRTTRSTSRKLMIDEQMLLNHQTQCHFCSTNPGNKNSPLDLIELQSCEFTLPEKEETFSFQKVMKSPDREKWVEAMAKEINSLEDKGCWRIERTPPGTNIIRSFYVFKIKTDAYGNTIKFKARLVAKGNSQIQGIDYSESYSPVARMVTLRSLLAISSIEGLHIHQLDVNTAYINADLHEIVYMAPPPDIQLPHGHTFRLLKSIYGLRQAGLNWFNCISDFLISLNFDQLEADPCSFIKNKEYEDMIIIIIYVDDILVASKCINSILETKTQIKSRFDIEDSGEINYYLGIDIKQINGNYSMNQTGYIEKITKKFQIKTQASITSPLPTNFEFNPNEFEELSDEEKLYVQKFPARQLIGAVNFISICTRPDISFAISLLSRYQDKMNLSVTQAIIHLMKFIWNTRKRDVQFSGECVSLVGYSDSDWAGDVLNKKSTSGFILYIGNGPILWQSKLQSIVALSSTEAEYVALSSTAKETTWIKSLLREWGYNMKIPTTLYCDNQGAIQLTINKNQRKRTRHIEIKYHHIRNLEQSGEIIIAKIHTSNMIADLLTKNTSTNKHLTNSLMGYGEILPCLERIRKIEYDPKYFDTSSH